MSIKIALAGNPNSGKTTLFNVLTGSNQFVGNWPGVTVDTIDNVGSINKFFITGSTCGIISTQGSVSHSRRDVYKRQPLGWALTEIVRNKAKENG